MRDGDNSSDAIAALEQIRARIEAACARANRQADEIVLIGASKTVPAARIETFVNCGLEHVGENYVQEGVAKVKQFARSTSFPIKDTHFHFIGSLQSNKARETVEYFDFIHSVDRQSLINALDKAARQIGKTQNVLIQVNLGDEASKAGCALEDTSTLAAQIAATSNLKLCGLMCLPPYDENPETRRPYFRKLRKLRDEIQPRFAGDGVLHLSMGMSDDFEIAIEEGATMIRVGTLLFGKRDAARHK